MGKLVFLVLILSSVCQAEIYAISLDGGEEKVFNNKVAAIRFVLINQSKVKQITETKVVVMTDKLSFRKQTNQ